jgi:EmrB/QacA subfamily drug resistance transporter
VTNELSKAQKVFTMLGALLGLLLAALDQTIVATAGPRIQKDLHIEPALYVWITTSYLVASTVLVPIYGKLSDLYGRRRILLTAIGIFLAGSAACGVSQNAMQLIAFRAIQGAGSAGLFTSAFAVVADLFPPAERGKWQGMFGAAFGLSSVVGPLLGGFITDTFGWNWVFYVNVPIGVVAVSFILSHMPPLRPELAHRPRLDIAGAIALAVGALPLLLALSLGHAEGLGTSGWPWMSWQILGLFATSLAGAIAFVFIEARAESPIIDLKLFRIKTVAIGSAAAFVIGGSFLGAIVFLPLFMVNVVGVSATAAGLTTTPLTFGIVAANITAGQAVSRVGKYKGILIGSLVVQCASFVLLAMTLSPESTRAHVSLKMILLGIGLGPSIPLFTLAIQTAVPVQEIGIATAAATFFRQMGGTIGIAIVGTIFATSFAASLDRDMPADARAQMAQHQGEAGDGDARVAFDVKKIEAKADADIDASAMSPEQKAAAKARAHERIETVGRVFKVAFTEALVKAFWVSLAIALLGLLLTAFLPALPLRAGPKPPAAGE